MKLDKEEKSQLKQLVLNHIGVLKTFVLEAENATGKKLFSRSLEIAKSIYTKLSSGD